MSLLKPSLGDLIDRFSILTLKKRYSDSEHFREESIAVGTAVTERMKGLSILLRKEIGALGIDVLNVNTLLWKRTDEHYQTDWCSVDYDSQTSDRACKLLVEIMNLNKERIRLKEEIDKLSGEFLGREKIDV